MAWILIGTFIALALAGCSTGVVLTDEGTQVQNVSDVDMPTGCNLLGDVRIGIPPDAAMPGSRDELAILMTTGRLTACDGAHGHLRGGAAAAQRPIRVRAEAGAAS